MSKEALSRKLQLGVCVVGATVALAAIPSSASALGVIVNSTGDGTDATPGNMVCETATGNNICTLRAAIGETNALAGLDSITFDAGIFDGTAATSTINLTSQLPSVTSPINIDGGSCLTGGMTGDPKPCTAINSDLGASPDTFGIILFGSATTGSSVKRLAIYNASTAIASTHTGMDTSPNNVTVEGNWLGMDLNESPGSNSDGNQTGVSSFGNGWDIGGTTAQERNVFRAQFSSGVQLRQGDNSVVAGNYFGTRADGTPDSTLNGIGVWVMSDGASQPELATGNVIGGADPGGGTPSTCDGPCNLLALPGSGVAEIELDLSSGPAGSTAIQGNFIGLTLAGAEAFGAGTGTGVDVGNADDITIGGATADLRNFIGGGDTGINAEASAERLTVRNNYVGVEPGGIGQVAPNLAGAQIGANTAPADRPQILDNIFVGDSTAGQDGLRLTGSQGLVQGNRIGRDAANAAWPIGEDAVEITGLNYLLIDNDISNGRATGVNINGVGAQENILNGNTIFDNGAAGAGPGARIQGGASQNTIGDQVFTTPGNINVFANNSGDAIELLDDATDNNLLIGNLAGPGLTGGADLFADLGGDAFGNVSAGPNGGVQAPTITFATATNAAGTAPPNALVVLYTGGGAHPDTILANGMADGSGNWSINYAAIPNGTNVFANQTPATTSNTSELAGPAVSAPLPPPPPAGGGGLTPTPTTSAPTPTGQRAAALKKCGKKKSARARRNCKKRANKLPV